MTVPATTRRTGPYDGDGSTVDFDFDFKVFSSTDVAVVLTDADDVETVLSSGYSVAINPNQESTPGGTITLTTAPAVGEKATLIGGTPYSQTVAVPGGGNFRPEVVEQALDRMVFMIQRMVEEVSRGLRMPVSSGASVELPLPEANALLGWDAAGEQLTNLTGAASVNVSSAMTPVVQSATVALARTALGLTAVGDALAVAASAAAARSAISAAASGANSDITSVLPSVVAAQSSTMINGTLVHSRAGSAGSAETIAIKTLAGTDPSAGNPVAIVFRSATPGTGDYTILTLTAATSITIPSTATMGVAAINTAFRLWIVGFNDAGTFRLGVIRVASASGIHPLSAWGIASSTIMDTASDSAQVFYTGAAVTGKAYTVLGYSTWETGLGAIGTWNAAPTRTQLFGPGVRLPGDRVQVAYGTSSGGSSTTSTSYVDVTGSSVSITLSSAANAVISNARAHSLAPRVVSFNTGAYLQLVEGSTVIDGNYLSNTSDNDGDEGNNESFALGALTFPNSASAVTYKLQHKGSGLGGGENITTDTVKVLLEEVMT